MIIDNESENYQKEKKRKYEEEIVRQDLFSTFSIGAEILNILKKSPHYLMGDYITLFQFITEFGKWIRTDDAFYIRELEDSPLGYRLFFDKLFIIFDEENEKLKNVVNFNEEKPNE